MVNGSVGKCHIALATQGTRGDFQPILALALGLRRAGHATRIFGNEGHCKSAQEFGFDTVECCEEIKDLLQTEAGKKAMETGDLATAFGAMDASAYDDWNEKLKQGFEDFPVDLIVYTPLIAGQIEPFGGKHLPEIPLVPASYQPQSIPSNDFGPALFYRVPMEEGQPILSKWVMQLQYSAKTSYTAIEDAKARGDPQEDIDKMLGPEYWFAKMFRREEFPISEIMAYSNVFWPAPADWPESGYLISGRWALSKEDQEENVKNGGTLFNAGSEHQVCSDFIAAGEVPVYIGWGSMTVRSNEHMACLAVDALRIAKKRGIIVAGWADVSSESLAGAPNKEELQSYCETNVLFLKSAPHEWLFPQCACCVHHGGIGTTMASLGAGSPTIVTPVFADQHDIAAHVTKNGWGRGTALLAKLTSEELGQAISKVCADSSMKAKTVELAECMAKEENGVSRTVAHLEDFIQNVRSGEVRKKYEAFLEMITAWRKKNQKMTLEKITTTFIMELNKKFPVLKTWNQKVMDQFSTLIKVASQGKLLYVKGSSCLARDGEKLKSDEVGRYREFAFLQLLEKKGSRIRVELLKGIGPESGWVTSEVKGVQIVAEVAVTDIAKIQEQEFTKMFSDVLPAV